MDKNSVQLKRLKLKNYRAFSNLDIDLAPLTLLTGANSSGKSSVLSAIASVLQTRGGRLFPFDFIPNGVNCSLGGFKDIVHGGGARSQFTIGLTIEKADVAAELEGTYRYSPVGDHILPAAIRFQRKGGGLEIMWDTPTAKYLCKYSGSALANPGTLQNFSAVISALSKIPQQIKFRVGDGDEAEDDAAPLSHSDLVSQLEKDLKRASQQQGKWVPLKTAKAHELKEQIAADFATKGLVDAISRVSEDIAEQFTYVGPVRAHPERYYSMVERGTVVDPVGALAMQQLAVWKRNRPKLFKEVVHLLSELRLVDHVRPSSSSDDILKVLVKPSNQKRFVNLADVGFGLSQVLPIITKDVELGPRGTMLVNQPEVHLHPSAQAQLANYFSSRLENRRYVIETHSEYLINRLRLRVAEGEVKSEDVLIWYFDWSADGKVISHRITIESNGNLLGAPPSFFSTYSFDAFKLVTSGFGE